MKAILFLLLLAPTLLIAADPAPLKEQKDADLATKVAEHQKGSGELSDKQDQLSADVQQLEIEQTNAEVSQMLKEVGAAMDEASQRLLEHDTGSPTIAAQTDVIEKIHDAAKKHQQQSGKGEAGGAMMDMMEEMMGKEPGDKPGEQKGKKPGDQGGQGMTGDSNSANSGQNGANNGGKEEQRRVPKASGTAGQSLPSEFQSALDAYNRAAGKLFK